MQPAAPPPSNPYYGAPIPGMPPPPPSYDQAMHHPVAPPNYIPQQTPMQVLQILLKDLAVFYIILTLPASCPNVFSTTHDASASSLLSAATGACSAPNSH